MNNTSSDPTSNMQQPHPKKQRQQQQHIQDQEQEQTIHCPILHEHLDACAVTFLLSQGIYTADDLLSHAGGGSIAWCTVAAPLSIHRKDDDFVDAAANRANSVLGADSPLTQALYEWRFVQNKDPKPSSRLQTFEVSE